MCQQRQLQSHTHQQQQQQLQLLQVKEINKIILNIDYDDEFHNNNKTSGISSNLHKSNVNNINNSQL
jgi:endo-alpha-1,4-polygalactosaminidase (GH114 family)